MKGDCRIADIGCIKCPIVSFPFRELPFFIAERRSKRIDTFRFSPIKGIVGYLVFVFAGDKRILCIPVVKGQMALFRTADRGEIGRIGNRLGSIAVQPVSGKRLGIVDWSNKTCPFLLPSGQIEGKGGKRFKIGIKCCRSIGIKIIGFRTLRIPALIDCTILSVFVFLLPPHKIIAILFCIGNVDLNLFPGRPFQIVGRERRGDKFSSVEDEIDPSFCALTGSERKQRAEKNKNICFFHLTILYRFPFPMKRKSPAHGRT